MRKYIVLIILIQLLSTKSFSQISDERHNLVFSKIPAQWDEALMLGNGFIGALIWEKDEKLRISLDRSDLWDETFIEDFNIPQFSYYWVYEQWKKNNYDTVQKLFDLPYEIYPTPTKIPCAAIEFDISDFGELEYAKIDIKNALCIIKWKKGITFKAFIHANKNIGWYRFEGIDKEIKPILIPPKYGTEKTQLIKINNSVDGSSLSNLIYPTPIIDYKKENIIYVQKVKDLYEYKVSINFKQKKNLNEGCFKIENSKPYFKDLSKINFKSNNFTNDFRTHLKWWKEFWNKSSISIPDEKLERQWYLELYKFGCVTRKNSPPITLQAIWTADNGKLPPWKGDIHNDLNVQLSYWLCYSGNHLEEGESLLNWLMNIKNEAKNYTKRYFKCDGLNIPGVATLSGKPMGGWIQYSLSPTISAWLAQHFYLHWRYSMDRKFLKEKAYPFIKEVATFLENVTLIDKNGKRILPISSSPEINDNSINAWFSTTTNYDLALMKWLFIKASELAKELNDEKASYYEQVANQFPEFAYNDSGLLITKNYPLKESHRHFSHLMAIHPLGLLKWDKSELDRKIISNSLKELERLGSSWWCGYSYSWLGGLYARAKNGEKAYESLKTFSECFCLPNSFHANGDQSGTGKSNFTYRPFTLEGNFAFASSLQEMLIQSNSGIIELFPAVPPEWKDISFKKLRAEGAFLVDAVFSDGLLNKVVIYSEKGGKVKVKNTFKNKKCICNKKINPDILYNEVIEIKMEPKERIVLSCLK
ncbi:MAG TPA: hypothetical protein VIR55_05015 [Ignavibacteria bacterium]